MTGLVAPRSVGQKGLLLAAILCALPCVPLPALADAKFDRLLRQGEYEKLIAAAPPRSDARSAVRQVLVARAEMALGRTADARLRLEYAVTRAPSNLPLRAALLQAADAIGDGAQVDTLVQQFLAGWPDGRPQRASVPELVAMGIALRFANDFNRANELFRQAAIQSAKRPEPQIAWGEMLIEKHALVDAERSFAEALRMDPRHPEALVGAARVAINRNYDREAAVALIERALAENPRHAPALALRAELELDAGAFPEVRTTVAALLQTNPQSRDASWINAALEHLLGNPTGYARERERWLAQTPHNARFFALVAEALVRHRRYEDARAVASQGVTIEPRNARCLAVLGTTLLRMGDEDEGLQRLREAFAIDPYDSRTFNQLELFEKTIAQKYTVYDTAHFRFRIEKHTRPAIANIVAPFLEDVFERYASRYAYRPPRPIVIELYGKPEDFAIRTVGLPDLDVEAVCFGRVITAHAPTLGNGSWGLILAHELAHVFALGLGNERVPRWFTEGLAEVETTHLHAAWTRREHMVLHGAMRQGRVPSLGNLSSAFIDARTPEQAIAAYMLSAHAVAFLEQRHGFGKLRQALVDFGKGMSGDEVLNRITGMTRAQVEQRFTDELNERYRPLQSQFLPTVTDVTPPEEAVLRARRPDASIDDRARAGLSAIEQDDRVAARRWLALAKSQHKTATANPLVSFLEATIAEREHAPATIVAALSPLVESGIDGYDLRTRLGLSSVEIGNNEAAERHFIRATELCPEQLGAWAFLSRLYEQTNRPREHLRAQTQAFLLDPQNARLGKEIVQGAMALQLVDSVIEIAPLVVFIDPGDPELQLAHGKALHLRGEYGKAIRAFENALALSVKNPEAVRAALGELYVLTGLVKPMTRVKPSR